ncbi:MAG: cytochrome c biogenesis protein CcsA [Acidobacteria bacterium]|nr:cytochrome c biogenesis protein CcsA [Acidobacteriota bacterium]
MNTLIHAGQYLLPLAYLLLVVDYSILFLRRHPLAERLAPPLLLFTLCLHLAFLFALGAKWQQLPTATIPQALSLVAFAAALVYGVVEWIGDERTTGVWMMTLVFLLQLLSSVTTGPEPPPELHLFRSPAFVVHISLALVGYSAAVVAAVYGFLFLSLHRELKSGRFRLFFGRLPPLEILDRMTTGALVVSFLGLAGAVAGGMVWGVHIGYAVWWRDPKVLLTVVVAAGFGTALLLRQLRRWQGRQLALTSVVGLLLILLSMMIGNFVSGGFHPF